MPPSRPEHPLRSLPPRISTLGEDGGSSIIEIALILPVFFLFIFGFINFCLVLYGIGNANFASRAALRYASLHSSTSYKPTTQQDLNAIVAAYIPNYPTNTYSISSSYYPSSNTVGSGVYVTLNISYSMTVLGASYTPVSYSTTGVGIVLQ